MKRYAAVTSGTALTRVIELYKERHQTMFPVVDNKESRRYLGYITYEDVSKYIKENPNKPITSGEIFSQVWPADATRHIHVHRDDPLELGLRKITTSGLPILPVVDDEEVYEGTVDAESIYKARLASRSNY